MNLFSYEQWDMIADAYIPALLILLIATAAIKFANKTLVLKSLLASFVGGVIAVYALMFIDKALGIWAAFGADYSTHTALALVLMYLNVLFLPRSRMYQVVGMIAYAGLMLYQEYHTVLDIISTTIVILPILAGMRLVYMRLRASHS